MAVLSLGAVLATAALAAVAGAAAQQACNNSPLLCTRAYNNITYLGAHDSSFLRDKSTGNSAAGNQFRNATVALDAGLLLLQTQLHQVASAEKPDAALRLCHSSCGILDAGPLDGWLAAVRDWLVQNPSDVVTLVLVNADRAPPADIAAAFERSGMAALAYRPPTAAAVAEWPSLQTMIGQGGRLVTFITNMAPTPQFPCLLPEFNHIFETPFEVTQLSGFNCTVDRPKGAVPADRANYMSLVNHFKYHSVGEGPLKDLAQKVGIHSNILVPDAKLVATLNAAPEAGVEGSLGKHLAQCRDAWRRAPNFVLVDFWDVPNPLEAVDRLNGVATTVGRKPVPAATAAAPSTSQLARPSAAWLAACLAVAWSPLL